MKTLSIRDYDIKLRDIKTNPLNTEEVEYLAARAGSFEAIINKRGKLFQTPEYKGKALTENDYGILLAQEYTALKRPVLLIKDKVFIGNDKKTIEAAGIFLERSSSKD